MLERARAVLTNFPDDERVESRIAGNLVSGFFHGNISDRIKGHLEIARKWAEDSHPRIRKFANRLITGLEEDLSRHLIYEQEEGL